MGHHAAVAIPFRDLGDIRFAAWVGPGRDPQVAYLDARQLVIGTAELTTHGWLLHDDGTTANVLGGVCDGPIDRAILHRVAHTLAEPTGEPSFMLHGGAGSCIAIDGLCDLAQGDPRPPMPFDEPGSFWLGPDFAVQWATWEDAARAGTLRRAVYLDDRHLLEAAPGIDGRPRLWPARGLASDGLELVVPSGREATTIKDRIATVTAAGAGSTIDLA